MIEDFPLTPLQLNVFLYALEGRCKFDGDEWKCGGPEFPYAKKVLTSMEISEVDQEKVLEICRKNGGHCDCEILMNVSSFLLGEESV